MLFSISRKIEAHLVRLASPVNRPKLIAIDLVRIERFRVVVATDPPESLFVFGIPLFGEHVFEILKARRPTAVLRRASVGPTDADRVGVDGLTREDVFDLNQVLPIVAKVIDVCEGLYPNQSCAQASGNRLWR